MKCMEKNDVLIVEFKKRKVYNNNNNKLAVLEHVEI